MMRAVQFTKERVQCLQGEKVLLFITHAGVIRTLCCCRDGRNPDELLHYRIGYGEYMVWGGGKSRYDGKAEGSGLSLKGGT